MAFQYVCDRADVVAGEGRAAKLTNAAGEEVELAILCDEEGTVHAISRMCTHGDVPLEEGDVEGCEVECWAHGARFNLCTGAATLPAVKPVKVYPVELRDGAVQVDVDNAKE